MREHQAMNKLMKRWKESTDRWSGKLGNEKCWCICWCRRKNKRVTQCV